LKVRNEEDIYIPQLLASIFSSFSVSDDGIVQLLPHVSATDIGTLVIIAEHCIHAALQDPPTLDQVVEKSTVESPTLSSPFAEVDAMDYCKKWYKAVIVQGSLHSSDGPVKVHFVGCTLHHRPSHQVPPHSVCRGFQIR
jgi:hypothetical protein